MLMYTYSLFLMNPKQKCDSKRPISFAVHVVYKSARKHLAMLVQNIWFGLFLGLLEREIYRKDIAGKEYLPVTECPKIYRKSVLYLLKYRFAVYLSRCSTDLH